MLREYEGTDLKIEDLRMEIRNHYMVTICKVYCSLRESCAISSVFARHYPVVKPLFFAMTVLCWRK